MVQGLENLVEANGTEEFEDALFITARIEVCKANLEDLAGVLGLVASLGVDRIVLMRRGTDFSMAHGAQIVSRVMRTATLNRLWSMCTGFPPCIMRGCERHLSELLEPVFSDCEKSDRCQTCVCRDICDGPPKDYVAQHGAEEFRPVTVAPYLEDVKHLAQTRSLYAKG